MKVLVTDGDERAALAATRSLGRLAAVHVAERSGRSLAGASRFATARHRLPDALAEPARFRDAVAELVRGAGIGAVLPVTDPSCVALLPEPAALAPAVLLAPSWPVYRRLSDKHAVAELAARHGIASPPGGLARSADQAARLARELGWPVIVKPVASVAPDAAGAPARSAAVARIADEAELVAHWQSALGGGPALVQRCVPGFGEGLFLLRRRGRTLAAFAHRRLREKPPSGGVSVLRESIAVDAALQRRLEAVLDEAGFEGVAMAEFRTDGRTRWLMEFNVRLWGSLQLAIDAGVDFPRLLLSSFSGDPGALEPPPVPRLGVRSRWLLGDVDHALALWRGQCDARGRSGARAAARVLLGPAGPGVRLEVLRASDPRPFCAELSRWLRDAWPGGRSRR